MKDIVKLVGLGEIIRQTKVNHRRITGLRNWNSYIQRNGELIVLIRDALP
ncbi:hypothetical protein [Paenibacillus sp. 32O-W]|nr:hypothetical protein [Paenibacillus sp. 32O-W]